jgi:hypothetical protein
MNEALTPEQQQQQQQTPEDGQLPSNEPTLPSETPAPVELESLTQGLEELVKDGMIGGKFKTVADMMASYKDLEAKYANARRELVQDGGNQQQQQEQQQQEQQQLVQKQQEVINDLLPKFIENGMQLNDELIQKAKEVGIDERDIKLKAYEVKEAAQKAYSVVGGKENYEQMLNWAKEALPQEKKVEFDKGLASDMSEFAIKGLWYEFEKAKKDGSYERITGNPSPDTLRGYTNRAELYRDKDFAEQARRRGDNTLWEKYQAKLRVTPQSVLGI